MGTQTLIDIIGSSIVFGWIMLMALRLDTARTENLQTYHGELQVQQNLVEVTRLLEYDFRKIGYCAEPSRLPDPTKAIVFADSNRIRFLTDVDIDGSGPDGFRDSITYFLGPASELSATPNPRDRMLYRVVNNESPNGANLGITQFSMVFFDGLNNQIPFPITGANLQRIQTIQITIKVETTAASLIVETTHEQYAAAFWQQVRLSSRNYSNR